MNKLSALITGILLLPATMAACGGSGTTASDGGNGGAGGATSTTWSESLGGAAPACTDPTADCPAPSSACVVATCAQGECATANTPDGTPTASQIPGDCKQEACDGAGAAKIIPDDADIADDDNDCTADACSAGSPVHTPLEMGATCTTGGGKVCGTGTKEGICVACLTSSDCTGGDVCDTKNDAFACVPATCLDGVQDGDETGVDCGGPTCSPCGLGAPCDVPTDCVSGVCQDGVCAPCGADSDCPATSFCDAATGACAADQSAGSSCTSAAQCQTDHCVDGVCCDTACGGFCEACSAAKKGEGADGVCGSIVAGEDPDDDCAADSASTCGKSGMCNGAGACELYVSGTVCVQASCASGVVHSPSTCNGTGTCVDGAATSCGEYQCNAGGTACLAACSADSDCASGSFCGGAQQCVTKLSGGAACTGSNQCQTGSCADGVCCNSACNGPCVACSAAKKGSGADGVCAPIATGVDPDDECAADAASTCGKTGECDGAGACQLHPSGTVCALSSCGAGVQQNTDTCNGAGTCIDGGSTSCGNFVCDPAGSACLASCGLDADCVAGSYCDGANQCAVKLGAGDACTAANQCQTGSCVDGVCCDTACIGTCTACSAAKKGSGTDGTCGSIVLGADPDAECAGAFSCNGAGACQSCSDGTQDGDETGVDCGGFCAACGVTSATAGLSCLDLLQKGTTTTGSYWIKPTGTPTAFQVYCDQTTSGGGWTALPLRFADAAMWSITQAGSACVTISAKDNVGGFAQSFSSNTGTFADTLFKFVPAISVSAVRLVAFNHSNGGTCNSMDYTINSIPAAADTAWEGWWFSGATATDTRAFTFPDGNCPSPYVAVGTSYCTRDSNLGAALFTLDRSLTYSSAAPLFQMVLRQGCQSSLCTPTTNGERFNVSTPPDADGIWRKGIFVK